MDIYEVTRLKSHIGHALEIREECDHHILLCKTCQRTVKSEEIFDADDLKRAIDAARKVYADPSNDDVEVDDNALVSVADGGIWVQMWGWLADFDLSKQAETKETPAPRIASAKDEIDLIQAHVRRIWGMDLDQFKYEHLSEDSSAFLITLAQVLVRHLKKSTQGGK